MIVFEMKEFFIDRIKCFYCYLSAGKCRLGGFDWKLHFELPAEKGSLFCNISWSIKLLSYVLRGSIKTGSDQRQYFLLHIKGKPNPDSVGNGTHYHFLN